MRSLDEVQVRIREGLLASDAPALKEVFGWTAGRFAVHRRHFVHALTGALEKTFPAIVSLVDRRFFAYVADAFIRAHPPLSPCLFEYGGALPDFLEAFPACETIPYVGDVARFEWALHCAFHAPDVPEQGAVFLPAVQHVTSRWPVYAIWRAATGRADGPVDASAGPVYLLVYRAEDGVFTEVLNESEFAFQRMLASHGDLDKAAASTRAAYCDFDETAARRRLTTNPNLLAVPSGTGDNHDAIRTVLPHGGAGP